MQEIPIGIIKTKLTKKNTNTCGRWKGDCKSLSNILLISIITFPNYSIIFLHQIDILQNIIHIMTFGTSLVKKTNDHELSFLFSLFYNEAERRRLSLWNERASLQNCKDFKIENLIEFVKRHKSRFYIIRATSVTLGERFQF